MSVNGCELVSRKDQAVPEPGRLTASETRFEYVHVRSVANIPVGEGLRSR